MGEGENLRTYLRGSLNPREVADTAGQGLVRLLVSPEALPHAAQALAGPLEARLLTAMGRDLRQERNAYAIHYLFWLPRHRAYVDLVAELPPADPAFPSLTALLPVADWPEREARDLLGLLPVGHPRPAPLLHREGWPSDYYPLRKDAPSLPVAPPAGGVPHTESAVPRLDPAARMGTLIGTAAPSEPGQDGVSEVPLQPDDAGLGFSDRGEAFRLFYGHRGIERLCEGRSLGAALALIERVCGSCAFAHALAFCQAVEAAAGIEAPAAAGAWRMVLLELERIRAHLGWVVALCAAAGRQESGTGAAALVEPLLALTEALTGSRRATGAIRPGGLARAIPERAAARAREAFGNIPARWARTSYTVFHDEVLARRLRGHATLELQTAEQLGAVGPIARASGLAMDCQSDSPHDVAVARWAGDRGAPGGDAAARLHVHLEEIAASLRQLDTLLAKLPAGGHSVPIGRPLAGAQGVGRVEAPEGEHLHWLILGPRQTVERLHIRSAAYACWPAALAILAHAGLTGDPLALASFGLCTACVDR